MSVEQHIAERKAIAEDQMEDYGPVRRTAARAGLATANGIDRVSPFSLGGIASFAWGAVKGVVKGASLGFIVGVIAVALGASAAGGLIYTAMAVGAIGYGILYAAKGLQEHHANGGDHKLSDRVAEMTGATPSQAQSQDRGLQDYFNERREIYGPYRYAEQERNRRAQREQEGHHHHR